MTRNKRTQFLTLDVLLGFATQAQELKGLNQRAWGLSVQILSQIKRMLAALGPASDSAAADIWKRWNAVKQVIADNVEGDLYVIDYCNAMLVLAEVHTRLCPSETVRAEWEALFDKLQAFYETLDEELEEMDSMKRGTELGEKIWKALAS